MDVPPREDAGWIRGGWMFNPARMCSDPTSEDVVRTRDGCMLHRQGCGSGYVMDGWPISEDVALDP